MPTLRSWITQECQLIPSESFQNVGEEFEKTKIRFCSSNKYSLMIQNSFPIVKFIGEITKKKKLRYFQNNRSQNV